MRLPITKERVKVHFTYFWWAYMVAAAVIVFGWNLLYTTTGYRSPANKTMEWYYQDYISTETEEKVLSLMKQLNTELDLGMEEMTFISAGTDATYGSTQLTVWIGAGQGDIYQLSSDQFKNYAAGAFLNLQPWIDSGALNLRGLKAYMITDEDTGERYPAGFYTDGMTGLKDYGVQNEGMVIGVLITGGNDEATIRMLNRLIELTVPEETSQAQSE